MPTLVPIGFISFACCFCIHHTWVYFRHISILDHRFLCYSQEVKGAPIICDSIFYHYRKGDRKIQHKYFAECTRNIQEMINKNVKYLIFFEDVVILFEDR